jgi:hypothetical protein
MYKALGHHANVCGLVSDAKRRWQTDWHDATPGHRAGYRREWPLVLKILFPEALFSVGRPWLGGVAKLGPLLLRRIEEVLVPGAVYGVRQRQLADWDLSGQGLEHSLGKDAGQAIGVEAHDRYSPR